MKTRDLDTMLLPRDEAEQYSQRLLVALDSGGAWSREANALLAITARLGLRLHEDLLVWSDVRDLQAIRLCLVVRYYAQLHAAARA